LRKAAAGGTITRWLNSLIGGHASDITEYRVLLFGFALVVMMIFRPQGLLPSRRRAAELSEAVPGQALGAAGVAAEEALVGEEALVEEPAVVAEAPSPTHAAAAAALPVGAAAGDHDVVLQLDGLRMEFGGVVALQDTSLEVHRSDILTVIGPNGAGKTTIFNCVTGVFRPTAGAIRLNGRDIVGRSPHRITEAGVARTFQNVRLFPNMTALENVLVGTDARH